MPESESAPIYCGRRIPAMPNTQIVNPSALYRRGQKPEIFDPVLSFQLVNGFHVRKVLTGYLPVDADSKGFATLLEWVNLDYVDKTPSIGGSKHIIRLGVVQWQMRTLTSVEELLKHAEFFMMR